MRTRLDSLYALDSEEGKRLAGSRQSARGWVTWACSTWHCGHCEQAHIGTCCVSAEGQALHAIRDIRSGIGQLHRIKSACTGFRRSTSGVGTICCTGSNKSLS